MPNRPYARYTTEALALLGKLIQHGRKQRKMTETDLATRLDIARSTLQRVEKGDPKVAIGTMFEAAALVGVPLFDGDIRGVTTLNTRLDERIAVLPQQVRETQRKIIDDF